MKRPSLPPGWLWISAVLAAWLLCLPDIVAAKDVGADARCVCLTCGQAPRLLEPSPAGTGISYSQGNLIERRPIARVLGGVGGGLAVAVAYNSYDADGSRMQFDSVMGYGWTHSYNTFLFRQVGSMFRYDGEGRVTRYKLGPGGTFTAAPGYFETLIRNPDGSFNLTLKDQTVFTFRSVASTPFQLVGPVWRLTRIVDRNGNVTTLTYTAGNLVSVTNAYGRSLAFTYTAQKKVASIADPQGRTTTFQYDATGRKLTAIVDPNAKVTQYAYNFLYQLTQKVDRDGRVFTYAYSNNKPVSVIDGLGTTSATLGNAGGWATDDTALAMNQTRVYIPATTTETDGRGNVWRYEYDANGCPTRIIAPDTAAVQYSYSPQTLQISSVTDANGHQTQYRYDALGNTTQTTNPLGQTTSYTYEPTFNMVTSTIDPRGRTTSYAYDSRGNLVLETDAAGGTRSHTYDSHGNMLTETDKHGHTTSYAYDSVGNRVDTTDAAGHSTTSTYDNVGNPLTVTDANGHTTTYQYDPLYRPVRETDPAGHATRFQYDNEGNRLRVIDANDNVTEFAYDHRHRLTGRTDAAGHADAYAYDANNNLLSTIDRNNHATSYQYDVRNRPVRTMDAIGNQVTTTYDAAGNVLSRTDGNAHTTTYTYDALDRRTAMTDGAGNQTSYSYDGGTLAGCPACGSTPGSSLVSRQTDANGHVTYFKYDALDRLIAVVRKVGSTSDAITPADAVTSYTYDAGGNRLSTTAPNGNATSYSYDTLDRQVTATNAAGDVTEATYDAVGNVATTVMPNGNVVRFSYDPVDRQSEVRDSVGIISRYSYDAAGNNLTVTDGNGHTTSYSYDGLNRIITTTDPLNRSTGYSYDSVGNLIDSTDRNSHVTRYTYDAINRRTTTADPLNHITSYQYDAVGNLTRVTDANSHFTQYQYDAANRRVSERWADGATRQYSYDGVGNILTRTDPMGRQTTYSYSDLDFLTRRVYPGPHADAFTYDLSGRMLTAARPGWTVTFAYDGADRVLHTDQNGRAVTYSYDIPARTRTLTYPGGRVIVEETDLRGRLTLVDDGAPQPVADFTYDFGNRVTTRGHRNGTTTTYAYDANDWVTSIEHTFGATRVAGFGYDRNGEGSPRYEEHRHNSARSEAFQYDAADRLIDFKVGSLVGSTVPVPSTQTAYDLDPLGNWNSKTTDAVTETRTHNEVNELVTIGAAGLTYDDDGNLRVDPAMTYVYDEENRLVEVIRNSDLAVLGQYQYDALGRRVVKVASAGSPSESTYYFYDEARLVEEQSGGGATVATYVYGNAVDEVVTMDRGGQAYYYHQNHLGSVAALTNSAAAVVERYTYDTYGVPAVTTGAGVPVSPNAWGTSHSAVGNHHLFTGREFDEETGLYIFRARYYDAAKGRFLQRDPIGYTAGMNLYEYVGSNPITGFDPFGLKLNVAGQAIDYDSELYQRLSQNDFNLAVLDTMISSSVTFERGSVAELELELKMRESFVACMRKHSRANLGCRYPAPGGSYPETDAAGWIRKAVYKGKNASDALDAYEAGPSRLDCYSMGNLCMWLALRDALGKDAFNQRFKDKNVYISQQMSDSPVMHPPAKEAAVLIPGDFVQFHNAPHYGASRDRGKQDAWGRRIPTMLASENAVFEGLVGGKEMYCGFGITSKTAPDMLAVLLKNWNDGAKESAIKEYGEQSLKTWPVKLGVSLGNVRRPKPSFTIP